MIDYVNYLKSDQWRRRKALFIAAQSPIEACARCHAFGWVCRLLYGQTLHLHHKTYQNLGDEPNEDLELLCERCHEIEHYKASALPVIEIHACRGCRRPRITIKPFYKIEDIRLLGKFRLSKKITENDRQKFTEIMAHSHNGCFDGFY